MQSVGHLDSRESTPNAKIVTLLVRHLPEAIPVETLSRLFSHYGAISVRPCAGGRLRNCAYVDFNREELASQAQSQLNRLRFLGKVMSVERAVQPNTNGKDQLSKADAGKNSINPSTSLLEDGFSHENQSKGTTQTLVTVDEPIAPRLGVDYPFPPHLKYAYPPPDGNILTNIVNALIAVPQFYTQVLHLMNKMNIPAPFCMALPTPPLPSSAPAQPPSPPPPPPPIPNDSPSKDMSTDESELESSEDGDYSDPKTSLPPRKRPKRKAIIGPGVDKAIAHEAVGLKSATLVPKELPLIKKNIPVLQIKISSKSLQNESLDGENCLKEPPMSEKETVEIKPYALPQEIESGKLPAEEFLSLPIVKNYAAGNPATVLYIKNLAKDVIVDDFYYIFGSLFGNLEAARSNLTVKLMQEGRMRGQAFITFPSIDLASHALNLVNGYVFKGKPIIIQFGRNPKSDKIN